MAPKSARAGANSLYGQMDLTGVISTLESHWVVLDAELSEIRKDFATLKALTHKHGDFWSRPMAQLKKLRTQKENLLKECAAARPRAFATARLETQFCLTHTSPSSRAAKRQDQVPDGALQLAHPAGPGPVLKAVERRVGHQNPTSSAAVAARH